VLAGLKVEQALTVDAANRAGKSQTARLRDSKQQLLQQLMGYHRVAMTNKRTAIVLGGSGSVGTALLRELFHADGFSAVITVSRRSIPEAVAMARSADRKLVEKLVPDMKPEPLAAATLEAARNVDGDLEGFSVLGVGAGTAKLTLEEHRAVDVALTRRSHARCEIRVRSGTFRS
jgi:NAD(P)-dependent dehydrogenase (short-subunit alcohol dehydrogenase family)